jgi:hypothetical protein
MFDLWCNKSNIKWDKICHSSLQGLASRCYSNVFLLPNSISFNPNWVFLWIFLWFLLTSSSLDFYPFLSRGHRMHQKFWTCNSSFSILLILHWNERPSFLTLKKWKFVWSVSLSLLVTHRNWSWFLSWMSWSTSFKTFFSFHVVFAPHSSIQEFLVSLSQSIFFLSLSLTYKI